MSKPKFEIAQIIEQFGDDFVNRHNPNTWIIRALNSLRICRTSALGGHKEKCDNCEKVRISYNSCRNRHCPKCHASKQAFWVEDVSERIIDTRYFHIVFTVPEELNAICILDSRKFYNTLFYLLTCFTLISIEGGRYTCTLWTYTYSIIIGMFFYIAMTITETILKEEILTNLRLVDLGF